MRRVVLGQKITGIGSPSASQMAFNKWVEASLKQIEEASHIPDTGASQMTAVGLFVAHSTNGSFR